MDKIDEKSDNSERALQTMLLAHPNGSVSAGLDFWPFRVTFSL